MNDIAKGYHCPRWAELPGIPLYLDQLVMVIEDAIGAFSPGGEAAVTKTMINNYVKQKIVNPPEGKKYSRAQIAQLIQVSLLKRVFSIAELHTLLTLANGQYGEQAAYDMFCERLEALLAGAFEGDSFSAKTKKMGDEAGTLLDIALLALVSKLRVQSGLPTAADPREKQKEIQKEKQKEKEREKAARQTAKPEKA